MQLKKLIETFEHLDLAQNRKLYTNHTDKEGDSDPHVSKYTSDSSMMNAMLYHRHGTSNHKVLPKNLHRTRDEQSWRENNKSINAIQAKILKSHIPKTLHVFTGTRMDILHLVMNGDKKVHLPSFTSTSASLTIAKSFGNSFRIDKEKRDFLQTNGINANAAESYDCVLCFDFTNSDFTNGLVIDSDEQEIILPHSIDIKIRTKPHSPGNSNSQRVLLLVFDAVVVSKPHTISVETTDDDHDELQQPGELTDLSQPIKNIEDFCENVVRQISKFDGELNSEISNGFRAITRLVENIHYTLRFFDHLQMKVIHNSKSIKTISSLIRDVIRTVCWMHKVGLDVDYHKLHSTFVDIGFNFDDFPNIAGIETSIVQLIINKIKQG